MRWLVVRFHGRDKAPTGSTATPITSTSHIGEQRAHHCGRVTTTVVSAIVASASACASDCRHAATHRRISVSRAYSGEARQRLRTPGRPRQRTGLKLGPIGARQIRAGLSFFRQKPDNAFNFSDLRRFRQAGKSAGRKDHTVLPCARPDIFAASSSGLVDLVGSMLARRASQRRSSAG